MTSKYWIGLVSVEKNTRGKYTGYSATYSNGDLLNVTFEDGGTDLPSIIMMNKNGKVKASPSIGYAGCSTRSRISDGEHQISANALIVALDMMVGKTPSQINQIVEEISKKEYNHRLEVHSGLPELFGPLMGEFITHKLNMHHMVLFDRILEHTGKITSFSMLEAGVNEMYLWSKTRKIIIDDLYELGIQILN